MLPSEDEEPMDALRAPAIPSSPPYERAESGSIRSRGSLLIMEDEDPQSISKLSGSSLRSSMILQEPPMRKTFSAL
ncbi:hypothetical protein MMC11_009103, partial [Xylographa trunciseda]|nr:hypothetical protein [Xylographa trunciseda]